MTVGFMVHDVTQKYLIYLNSAFPNLKTLTTVEELQEYLDKVRAKSKHMTDAPEEEKSACSKQKDTPHALEEDTADTLETDTAVETAENGCFTGI